MTQPKLAENVRGRGRHYRHPVTGELYPSVTNIIGCLDKPAIPAWAAKEVAKAAWRNRSAILEAADEDAVVGMLKGAPWKQRDKAADVGSSVHAVADALASDHPLPSYSAEEADYVDAFLRWASDFDVRFAASEVTVFNREDGYAGTYDFLADIPGVGRVLGDHKTGKGVYPEVALQLAALRFASEAVVDGEIVDNLTVDAAVVVHLRPEGYAMHRINAGHEAYETVRALRTVWEWHKGGLDDGAISAPVEPTATAERGVA